MVDYKYSELFMQSHVDKQLKIVTDDGSVNITNEDLYFESFELSESICSESELTFGSCEAASVKFKIANVFTALKDKWLTITMTIGGNTDTPFVIGRYKVYSDTPTADRRYREIIAYDAMYDIINAEMSNWYNGILPNAGSTVTLKEFRTSFVSYFGLEQDEISLANDEMIVDRNIEPSEISGKDIITAICELNGCFGHIGRDGKFKYIVLPNYIQGLYPANDLYPADNLFPRESKTEKIPSGIYIKCTYDDYITDCISKLQIRQEENDIGAIVGFGDNCYIIEDNFLVYGKDAVSLVAVAENLYSIIEGVQFRPANIQCVGNPCLELGDAVRLGTKYALIETFILTRTLTGIQSLKDTYEAHGEKQYSEQVNSVQKSIIQLKGKTNTLERTVEETKSTITDVENNLQSQITQTAEQISSEVSRATSTEEKLSSQITQTATEIRSEVSSQIQATVTYDNIFEGTQFWGDRLWGNIGDATLDNEVLTQHSQYPITAYFTVTSNSTVYVSVDRMRETVTVSDPTPCFQVILMNSSGDTQTIDSDGVRFLSGIWARDSIAYGVDVPSGYTKMAVRLIGGENTKYRQLYVSENGDYIWKPSPADTPAEINKMYSLINQTSEQISTKVSKDDIISEINQSAEEVKIKANKINLDGAVVANATLTAPIISGGAVSFGANKVVINEEGIWVLGSGGVESPDFFVDKNGFVRLGANLRMNPAGIWWTDSAGVEHFKAWSSIMGF